MIAGALPGIGSFAGGFASDTPGIASFAWSPEVSS
jgi:hypothetical protein